MLKLKTNLNQLNNKRKLVDLYKDIVLVTRLRIFCTTNKNIKVEIPVQAFQFDQTFFLSNNV